MKKIKKVIIIIFSIIIISSVFIISSSALVAQSIYRDLFYIDEVEYWKYAEHVNYKGNNSYFKDYFFFRDGIDDYGDNYTCVSTVEGVTVVDMIKTFVWGRPALWINLNVRYVAETHVWHKFEVYNVTKDHVAYEFWIYFADNIAELNSWDIDDIPLCPGRPANEHHINLRTGDIWTLEIPRDNLILTDIFALDYAMYIGSWYLDDIAHHEFRCVDGGTEEEPLTDVIEVYRWDSSLAEYILSDIYYLDCVDKVLTGDDTELWLQSIIDIYTDEYGEVSILSAMRFLYDTMQNRIAQEADKAYRQGYKDGSSSYKDISGEEIDINFYRLLTTVITAPVTMVKDIINFEIELPGGGNLNLWHIVTFILSIMLVGFVIRKLR